MTTIDSTINTFPPRAANTATFTASRTLITLGLILLTATILRFKGLDREGRWGDEYFQTMQYDMSPYYVMLGARTNNQPPLDYLIGWAVTKVSRTTWMMRAPAAAFGVAGVAMLFILVRCWFGTGAALLAAALLAVAPLHWKLSQEARPYTIFVFAMLTTFWLFARAMDKPTLKRVLAYGIVAWLTTLTRGLAPLVVMLCMGIALSTAWLLNTESRRAVGRLWLATLIVGLLAVPMLLFLLSGDSGWTVFAADDAPARPSEISRIAGAVLSNAAIWAQSPTSWFGYGAIPLIALAVGGVIACIKSWRTFSLPARCTFAAMWLSGPAYLIVYSIAVAEHPICDRYGMFLTPMLIAFAACAFVCLMRRLPQHGAQATRQTALTGAAILVLLPASSTWALTNQYFHPDWRGSAEYLCQSYDGDDVIMVFADRPLGAGQAPYWGKLDWPSDRKRPLGESMWTLATSEPHWQRLKKKQGQCCVVQKYFVGEQKENDYRNQGIVAAPNGAQLTKLRGLDILEQFEGNTLPQQLIAACNSVIELPKENEESRAIAYLLRSRVEHWQGQNQAAKESYQSAMSEVPPQRKKWFTRITATHRESLEAPTEPRP